MGDMMQKESLWKQYQNHRRYPALTTGITCDVLIIGGGITGISCAFELSNSNQKIVLIDQNQIGQGITSGTTGKLTYLQNGIYQKLLHTFGEEIALTYYQSQKEAIQTVEKYVNQYHIDCNFQKDISYLFATTRKEEDTLQIEKAFFKRNQIPYIYEKTNPFCRSRGAIKVPDTAVFHPLKYLYHLAELAYKRGVQIYEKTKAVGFKDYENNVIVDTERGYIRTKKVVFACHYPFFLLPGLFPLRAHIERSYVCAGKVKDAGHGNAINPSNPTYSFRYHKDKNKFLIYCGASHKLGDHLDYQENYRLLTEQAKEFMPNVDYIWQNQDIMTNDYLPLIGRLQKNNDHLYIATGYNTWGMTNGVIAGKVIRDLILGEENPYTFLFAPYRGIHFDQIKNFTLDAYQNGKSYAISKLKNYYSFYLDDVKIRKKKGKKLGIYIDEDGKYHIVSTICPHMKCSLTFNMFQKTWDCPCHGSRFDMDGKCIEGPSLKDITIIEKI